MWQCKGINAGRAYFYEDEDLVAVNVHTTAAYYFMFALPSPADALSLSRYSLAKKAMNSLVCHHSSVTLTGIFESLGGGFP